MATLPPVTLGAIIFGAFTIVAMLHRPLERRFILSAPISSRPKRQFYLELSLMVLAGLIAVIYNRAFYNFPIFSGISLVFGCSVSGFFAGLDSALAREREIILGAVRQNRNLPTATRLFPVTRKFTLVAVATTSFVALIIILVIARDIIWLSTIEQTESALFKAQLSVTYEILFIMAILLAMIINLILSYSKNLRLLFNNETDVLERVSQGDLSNLVPVATNDEFGVIADHTNSMIRSLRHRIELISALKVAEEFQQNLLPHSPPEVPGLDLSGVSIYCQETGGDYFDYIELPDGNLGIVVADASDHGIGAAIHMTTARAFLLYGAKYASNPAELIDNVNQYLVKDSSQTGRFVSMFLLEIDPARKSLRWVRAGHEPAILYDPLQNEIQMLTGDGIALGVDHKFRFQVSSRQDWVSGSIIVIGTDGIHETHNADGRMYGRERMQDIIREHHLSAAADIQKAIIDDLHKFKGDAPQEDDITLVVVKLL